MLNIFNLAKQNKAKKMAYLLTLLHWTEREIVALSDSRRYAHLKEMGKTEWFGIEDPFK